LIDMKKTGEYICSLRKKAGMTQSELSERLGVTAQSVSNWERGESLPDTASLPDIALILNTSVDELLGGGSCKWNYRRRITVERMREALICLNRIGVLLGTDHFMYRTMVDALDERMNGKVEETFSNPLALDAYICEAIIACVKQGDYIDLNDVRKNITAKGAGERTLGILRDMGLK